MNELRENISKGNTLKELKKYEKAIDYYNKALKINPR
jgi:tetratricopeptide (TPR) repeat protein